MNIFQTAAEIANTIRLQRNHPKTQGIAFLLVEGSTDARFYQNLVNSDKCQVIAAHNKDNTVNALLILDNTNVAGVVAIVDADFDLLEGKLPTSQNLFLTDAHDLETMLIKSQALEKVLGELASETKISNFTNRIGKDLRTVLTESGVIIGYLRWVSLSDNLAFTFEELEFNKFVDERQLTLEVLKLIRTVKNKSQKPNYQDAFIRDRMESIKNTSHDSWHVCCGHDLVEILALGLRRTIGTNDANEVKPEVLSRSLRLAYEYSYFKETNLYQSLKIWEETNRPYIVLK